MSWQYKLINFRKRGLKSGQGAMLKEFNIDFDEKKLHDALYDIDIKTISYLEIYDIYPENWKYLIEFRTKQDKIKHELKPEAMTTLFKCRKCGSRSTSYYEVQTRAADEPMTQFITCLDCNTRWKQ